AAARHGRRLQALAAEAGRLTATKSKKERATPCQARIPAGRTPSASASSPATRARLTGSTTLGEPCRGALRAPDHEPGATECDATAETPCVARPHSPPRLRASA